LDSARTVRKIRVNDPSAERVAQNNEVFRRANDQIRLAADAHGFDAPIPFLCECANQRCTAVVRLTPAAYAEIRSHPRHFVTAPGHQAHGDGHEQVVERADDYEKVEKVGEAGQIVEGLAE
jgi:hypothetical protein